MKNDQLHPAPEDNEDQMLEKLKRVLGKTDASESESALLKDALDDALNAVKAYCNFKPDDPIPPGLDSTVVRIAADIWRADGYGSESAPQTVTSVKRGDVTTSFASVGYSGASGSDGAGFAHAYTNILNSYRKLVW